MDLEVENGRLRGLLAEREAALAAIEREIMALRARAVTAEQYAVTAEERAVTAEQHVVTAERRAETAEARIAAAEEATARLQRELDLLRRQIVGPKSERVVDPNQLPLPRVPAGEAHGAVFGASGSSRDRRHGRRRRPKCVGTRICDVL